MGKKTKKKKKIKVFRVFIVLIFLILVIFAITLLSKMKVKGYYIIGNKYYTDKEILEKTSLDKYPSFLLTTSFSINTKIRKDKLIDNIKIKKTLTGRFKVIVKENRILYYDKTENKSILENGEKIDYKYDYSPQLLNKIDKKIYNNFLSKIKKVNDEVLMNISEIKYDPNDIDNERFLLSMNDGNYVYLTLSKFVNINNYLEISHTLGNKNGILYLDYGNYFVPKE